MEHQLERDEAYEAYYQQHLDEQEQTLAYCDLIADTIKNAINSSTNRLIAGCGPVKMDLHPLDGYLISTKKFLHVMDMNGKHYLVTVEEV